MGHIRTSQVVTELNAAAAIELMTAAATNTTALPTYVVGIHADGSLVGLKTHTVWT